MVKLTKKWKRVPTPEERNHFLCKLSEASWGCVELRCQRVCGFRPGGRWRRNAWNARCFIRIPGIFDDTGFAEKCGPDRMSEAAARRDAERLAVEMLQDIQDGTKALMVQHGMDDSD